MARRITRSDKPVAKKLSDHPSIDPEPVVSLSKEPRKIVGLKVRWGTFSPV
jgi:hypothetical protein